MSYKPIDEVDEHFAMQIYHFVSGDGMVRDHVI